MPMTEDQRKKMLVATREAAAALFEDFHYLRQVAARHEHSKEELRRLSGIVRRMLVDDDLTPVSGPRLGRFQFAAPDIKPALKADSKAHFAFFASARVELPGLSVAGLSIQKGTSTPSPHKFNPELTIKLRLDGFMAQPAISLNGQWLSRRNAIKYASNFASGVHSKAPSDPLEELALRLYRSVKIAVGPVVGVNISFDYKGLLSSELPPFVYDPKVLNPILLELLATVRYITASEDTIRLEGIIAGELGVQAPSS